MASTIIGDRAKSGAIDRRSFAAYVAFFLSGASSLIFQTIWTRMLHHVFGATSVAISTVLTVFMAGLGLGAWLGGKYAHRIKHPIITYAIAEIGVGVWGLVVPLLVRSDGWLATVNGFLRAELGAESGLFMIARFLCVAPILIIPTTLMGSTLPLLTRHFVRGQHGAREAGARVGVLYAINTLGAATGPLLSAFFLMPMFGLTVTNFVACSLNLTLAALIWVSRRSLLEGTWKPGQALGFWPGTADPEDTEAKRIEALDKPREETTAEAAKEVATDGEGEDEQAIVGADAEPEGDDAKNVDASPEREKQAASDGAANKASKKPKKRKKAKGSSAKPSSGATTDERFGDDAAAARRSGFELPIPELARKAAFLTFAASGAAALAYEVVWSRALAMTIGSSIYSFALILETFLVGIAAGSAAMSAFLGQKAKPYLGIAITAVGLVLLANIPWAVDIVDPQDTTTRFEGSPRIFFLLSLVYIAPIVLAAVWVTMRMRVERLSDIVFREGVEGWKPLITVLIASIPVAAAVVNTMRFPGHLPKIILTVVALVAAFLVIASLLSRAPVLLVAIIQLFIAAATVASYVWQDEIPYAFAQLVVSIPSRQLPDHVGTVWIFNMLTIALCTFPASLGMGAMFPLTVRVWTAGGDKIARDVAVVYTGNTIGSIVGSWLPGFVLFALVGSERTLHLGVALNMLLALMMLIAGAADPNEDQRWWTWRRLWGVVLPALAAFSLAASAYPVLVDDWRWWTRAGAALGFLVLSVLVYQWLRAQSGGGIAKRSEPGDAGAGASMGGNSGSSGLGIVMSVVPVTAAVALAAVAIDPSVATEWALGAVYWFLRAFLVLAGAVASWACWREGALPPGVPDAQPDQPDAEGPYRSGKLTGDAKAARSKGGPGPDLPTWHAVTVYILSPLIPALLALLWLGTKHPDSVLRWNRTQMTLGVFRVSLAEGMLDPDSWGAPDLVYYNDGLTTTVSVERWGRHYALKNNGKVDASNGDDMPTQINVAAYPLLLHPRGPQDLDVAIVGFGSGVTVGTALNFPVRRVDVIELERSIPEAARYFEDVNHLDYRLDHWPFVQMDRLTVINDDGRNFLASTRQQYDVIISEPSNPWITGVSDLFTVDHWRITKQRLRPGGIYCQWVQLYELSPENIKTIYRTFASQFDHVVVLSADDRSSDTVMLGSDQPITLDLERVRSYFGDVECQRDDPQGHCYCETDPQTQEVVNPTCPGRIATELQRANIYSPFDIFARTLLVSREEVMAYTNIEYHRRGDEMVPDPGSTNSGACQAPACVREPAVLNTDDNARIEFAAPRDLIGFSRYEGYLSTIYSEEWPYGHPRGAIAGFGEGDDAARNYAELAMSMIAHGRYGWAGDFIERSQQVGRARETAVALEVLTHLLTSENEPTIQIEPPIPGPEMDRDTARALTEGFDAVRDSVDQRAYGAALIAMENIPAPLRLHSGAGMRFLYGYLLYKAADGSFAQYRASIEHLEDLTRTEPDYVLRHPEVWYFLARSQDAEGNYSQALRAMRAYVEARLVPVNNDADEVPEPGPHEAPSTDAEGEAPKLEHDDHG